MRLNQKGAIDIFLASTLAVVLVVGGFVVYRISTSDSSETETANIAKVSDINTYEECVNAGNPVQESYPEQCTTPEGETYVRELTEEEIQSQKNSEDKNDEDNSNQSNDVVEEAPEQPPSEPTPDYSLYNTPVPVFEECSEFVVAYVVNPDGAQLADTYYSSNIVKTLPFGTKAFVGCQDGEGAASMSVKLSLSEEFGLAGNPADFRTTYPYN